MAHIHYKFSSKLSYDTVVFDGPNISLTDLKKQIMGREKLRAGDCDLQIINAQTKEEFTEDGGHIPKGSSVIVRRIPFIGVKSSSNSKTNHKERSDVQIPKAFGSHRAISESSSTRALSFFSKMQLANLAEADVSEEDKIRVMMNQSSCEMMKMNSKLGPTLPENYSCYRCGNGGHHIRNCPGSGDKNFEAPPRIKKSTGIPRSFMVEVDDPNIKGVMLTSCGRYAIPAIDAEAYAVGKKEKPPFIPQEQPKCEEKEEPIPDELLCLICHDLLSDAVVIPCCGNSYCDDCIRTALLESETHVCPTCGQSDVSPDTLIANKFLRQAVNNFKKERGSGKIQKTSLSQNATPKPSPVPTLTTSTIQNKTKKPLQSPCTEQESIANKPRPEKSPLLSQSAEGRPATPEPSPVENSSESTSTQPEQSLGVTSNNEKPEKTPDDLEAVAPSGLAPNKDLPAAPAQLIPLIHSMEGTEQLQTLCVKQSQPSSDSTTRPSGSSTSRDSSVSTYPAGSLTESNSEQHRTPSSSSSYSSLQTTTSPLFCSPPFHTFVPTHQPLSSYLPGYPPTTPAWKLPIPPGAPLTSLCSSSTTSSIPVLIPKEWYRFQRKKKERSPHKRSFSHSVSKSSKSKSSRSYSGSSSRSESRSRSRSRHRSPHSGHRAFHSHSNPCRPFGYKRPRSPTPSSSSSPLSSSHSRSKSSSDHSQKNRHHGKRSGLSGHGSKRRGERSAREARKSSGLKGLSDTSCLELERQCYLQWKKEYQDWYDKYFSNYISQFHHLPFPPPPPPPPLFSQDSFYLKQEGETVRKGDGLPTSEDSNYSGSPPSNSSNDRHSPICHLSSDSCSSPKVNDDQSSPSRCSNDRPFTPSEVQVQPRDNMKENLERDSSLPDSLTKSSEEAGRQKAKTDDNLQAKRKVEDCITLRNEKKKKKPEKSPSPDSSGSINVLRQDERRRKTEPNSCKDGSPLQRKGTASDSLKSIQPLLKPNQPLYKEKREKPKDKTKLETQQEPRKDKGLNSCQNRERKRKTKPSTDSNMSEVHQHPEGSKTSDSKLEQDKKRQKQDEERKKKHKDLPTKTKSSKCLRPKVAEEPKSLESESLKSSDRRAQSTEEEKKESEASPLAKKDIWEGGVKVISQKKISININLDGKRKDEKTEQNCSGSEICTAERTELSKVTEEKATDENTKTKEKGESSPGVKSQEKILFLLKDVRESGNKAASSVDKKDVSMKTPKREEKDGGEKKKREDDDLDLWHCALEGVEDREQKTGKEEKTEREKDGCGDHKSVLRHLEKGGAGRGNGGEAQREDNAARSSSQRSKTKIHRQNDTLKHSSSKASLTSSRGAEGSQEATTAGGKPLEEKSNDRAKVTQNEPTQLNLEVPPSKREKTEKDVTKGEVRATPLQPSETRTNIESVEDNEQKSLRSTERARDRNRVTAGGRDQEERNSASAGSYSSVAPSCGGERERDRERTNERRREGERSKPGVREEERRRDWDSPVPKRTAFNSVSKDTERRELLRESDQSSSCYSRKPPRSTYVPDQNVAKRHRDASLDIYSQNKDRFYDYSYPRQSADYSYKDRHLGTQHSPPAYSHCRDRSTPSFEPPAGSQRGFTTWEFMQSKSRNEERMQKAEKPGKERKAAAGDEGGRWSRREENAQRLDERRRSSSSSGSSVYSSSSRRSSRDE
ncbi:E3 ubiquitin-protein ligase RBBP6 isoform X1 [Poecilia formosa]|uniref:E3 ubiquitin-protein ligase RBBP6 isoform X1 n=1 Tax=Poecilia formosa TaxID=48698 RepID=UPI000443C0C3|nr:PREDICTED: E3 ubiquitin-protein ligase RBBP6 isoform X1 [Poecilia formosa]